MFTRKKLIFASGVALLLVSILAVGTTLAQTPPPEAKPGPKAIYQDFLTRLAQNLGIGREDLTRAMAATGNQMLDEAVQKGRLTQERAEKIRERNKEGDQIPWFLGRHLGPRPGPTLKFMNSLRNVTLEALAEVTGKTADQVREELRSGMNLRKFLEANNIAQEQVRSKVVEIAERKLDQAVKDGKVTAEQAERVLERIKKGSAKQPGARGRGI